MTHEWASLTLANPVEFSREETRFIPDFNVWQVARNFLSWL